MAVTDIIKQHNKEIKYEVINKDKGYFRGVINEVNEDYAVGKAIEDGDKADYVSEKSIMDIIKD